MNTSNNQGKYTKSVARTHDQEREWMHNFNCVFQEARRLDNNAGAQEALRKLMFIVGRDNDSLGISFINQEPEQLATITNGNPSAFLMSCTSAPSIEKVLFSSEILLMIPKEERRNFVETISDVTSVQAFPNFKWVKIVKDLGIDISGIFDKHIVYFLELYSANLGPIEPVTSTSRINIPMREILAIPAKSKTTLGEQDVGIAKLMGLAARRHAKALFVPDMDGQLALLCAIEQTVDTVREQDRLKDLLDEASKHLTDLEQIDLNVFDRLSAKAKIELLRRACSKAYAGSLRVLIHFALMQNSFAPFRDRCNTDMLASAFGVFDAVEAYQRIKDLMETFGETRREVAKEIDDTILTYMLEHHPLLYRIVTQKGC